MSYLSICRACRSRSVGLAPQFITNRKVGFPASRFGDSEMPMKWVSPVTEMVVLASVVMKPGMVARKVMSTGWWNLVGESSTQG